MNQQTFRDRFLIDDGEDDGYLNSPLDPELCDPKGPSSPMTSASIDMVSSLNSSMNCLNRECPHRSNLSDKIVDNFMMLFDQANSRFDTKESRFQPNEPNILPIVKSQKDMYHTSNGFPIHEVHCDDEFEACGSLGEKSIHPQGDFRAATQLDINHRLHQTEVSDTFERNEKTQHEEIKPFHSISHIEKVESIQEDCSRLKVKKPFLRKGSRREPSALYRLDLLKYDDNSACIGGEAAQLEKLQELEKMQRDQIEQLEHRISIRAEARKAIMKQKLQKDSSESINTTKKADNNHPKPKASSMNGQQKRSSYTIASADDEIRSPVKNNHILVSSVNENKGRPQDPTPTQKTGSSVEIPPSSNEVVEDDAQVNTKDQWEEQWQVIKCMRKRQEAALRDAERHREEARKWAANERETVQRWVDQQKFCLKREKERLANSTMAIERKKKLDLLEEKATAAVEQNHKKAKEEIESLKAEIQKLKIDSDAFKSRARLSDKRLRDIISDKDTKLRANTEEVTSLQERNKDLTAKLEDYNRKVTSLKRRLSRSVQVVDGAHCSHDIHVNPEQKNMNLKSSDLNELSAEIYNSTKDESDEWTKNIDILRNIHVEETDIPDEVDSESTALRALSEYPDLIEEPTESWLQKHLDCLHGHSIKTKTEINQDCTATATKEIAVEEVAETCTPIRPAAKIDKESPVTGSIKISIDSSESQSFTTPASKIDKESPVTGSVKISTDSSESQRFTTPSKTISTHKDTCIVPNSRRIVQYQNGTQKETSADGTTIIRYINGDVKTSYINTGIIIYYYASSKTSHTSHPDGMDIYEFSNGQIERHFKSGRKEITFPDGTRKTILPDGNKETIFSDGVGVLEYSDGRKEIFRR